MEGNGNLFAVYCFFIIFYFIIIPIFIRYGDEFASTAGSFFQIIIKEKFLLVIAIGPIFWVVVVVPIGTFIAYPIIKIYLLIKKILYYIVSIFEIICVLLIYGIIIAPVFLYLLYQNIFGYRLF